MSVEMRETLASSIAVALNIANDLRREFDEPVLDDLPLGVPNVPHHCILARAFNFGCNVSCENENNWIVTFAEKEHRDLVAKALDESYPDRLREHDSDFSCADYSFYSVGLPGEISQIALAFDNGDLDEYNITIHGD